LRQTQIYVKEQNCFKNLEYRKKLPSPKFLQIITLSITCKKRLHKLSYLEKAVSVFCQVDTFVGRSRCRGEKA